MKKHGGSKNWLLLLLLPLLLTAWPAPAQAESERQEELIVEQADDGVILEAPQPISLIEPDRSSPASPYDDDQTVRVSIVLETSPTLERYSVSSVAQNNSALAYREQLQIQQDRLTSVIENAIGESLDVQWNLTLAANIISAKVKYGQIETIAQIPGVKEVVIERLYYPIQEGEALAEGTASPTMVTSISMTGMSAAWELGYTGAGSRIAIIDTGLDTDHQSLDAAAFDYSLNLTAAAAGHPLSYYDLLTQSGVSSVLRQLNVRSKLSSVSASSLYLSSKVPFAFNYIDKNYDVTHDHDDQGDHGSHVAGIAAANRYIYRNGSYVSAAQQAGVVGNAPDAQLLVMKVFGSGGGAYESDYMAAIEDAIILGADAINLSLGGICSGFATNATYASVLATIQSSGAVVAMAAGNSGNWFEYAATADYLADGYLYSDDVNFSMLSDPASYTQSLAVAATHNVNLSSAASVRAVNGASSCSVSYSDGSSGGNSPFSTLSGAGSGLTYDFVYTDGYAAPGDFDYIDLTGKILICSRGNNITFSDKASYAASCGAAATLIYNNTSGSLSMDLSGYTYTNPCASITRATADQIKALATEEADGHGQVYYTGQLTVESGVISDGQVDMADFSSWGVNDDLCLKPEISAPGYRIYSISSDSTSSYQYMSGTSMATPQIAGVAAVVSQYVRQSGLVSSSGLSPRKLTQSLLMSTATPLKDEGGNYYPLMQQGAGLVNGSNAISAASYIMVGADATPSYADGKVKAELGDDPDREGVYSFSFFIHNITDEALTYDLSADTFTQDCLSGPSASGSAYTAYYSALSTRPLSAGASFSGDNVAQAQVTVAANSSAQVNVTLTLSQADREWIDAHFPKGAFIQGFVFAAPSGGGVTHSIPVLAFYGGWTESSMFDGGSYHQGALVSNYGHSGTSDDSRTTYSYNSSGSPYVNRNYFTVRTSRNGGDTYTLGGNPMIEDEVYLPERDAIGSLYYIYRLYYLPLRNSYRTTYSVVNETKARTLASGRVDSYEYGEFYYEDYSESVGGYVGEWYLDINGASSNYTTVPYVNLNTQLTSANVSSGDVINISLTRLPEYYADYGLGAGEQPGAGATLSVAVTYDVTRPTLSGAVYDSAAGGVVVTAFDDNYVSAVYLYRGSGSSQTLVASVGSRADIQRGETAQYLLPLTSFSSGVSYYVRVYDYAMNYATYSALSSGHVLTQTPAQAPTHTAAGNTAYYTCQACGKYFSDAAGTIEIEEGSWIIPMLGCHVTLNDVLREEEAYYNSDYSLSIDQDYDSDKYDYRVSYAVAGVDMGELTPDDQGRVTIPGDQITDDVAVTVSKTPRVQVSLFEDYVSGWWLVLVSGAADLYCYDGQPMYEAAAYGEGVFAYLVQGSELTAEEVYAQVTVADEEARPAGSIPDGYDVSGNGSVDYGDLLLAYRAYTVSIHFEDDEEEAPDQNVAHYMESYLRADVNHDYRVDTGDVSAIYRQYSGA